MPTPSRGSGPVNLLLAALPDEEWTLLRPELECTPLAFRQVLQIVEQPVTHLCFPTSAVASMVTQMADGGSVEVATIGREGMIGLPVILGAKGLAQTVFIQIAGEGFRVPVERFREISGQLPALGRLFLRYTAALITQVAQGSACNRLHDVERRCARWLLMTQDRVNDNRFPLTHEFLALMLGVTRPSVSITAGILQKAGLIAYARGEIVIIDRPGLERACCECYHIITDEFRQLIQPAGST